MNLSAKDRIGHYLVPHLSEMVFDELSDGYLERAGITDILKGVPVPVRKSELGSTGSESAVYEVAAVVPI